MKLTDHESKSTVRSLHGVRISAYPPGFSAPIALVGDKVLTQRSREIVKFGTRDLKALITQSFSAMRERSGSSLSAVQIGVPLRIIVWDLQSATTGPHHRGYAINPKIVETSHTRTHQLEGCLSLPGARASVNRWDAVTIHAQDVNGRPMPLSADGLWARRLQHEIEHLDGTLYTNHLLARERRHVLRVVERRLGIRHVPPGYG